MYKILIYEPDNATLFVNTKFLLIVAGYDLVPDVAVLGPGLVVVNCLNLRYVIQTKVKQIF